jgi:hypothetical protein
LVGAASGASSPQGSQERRPHHGAADRLAERVLDDVVDEGEIRRLDAESRERTDGNGLSHSGPAGCGRNVSRGRT